MAERNDLILSWRAIARLSKDAPLKIQAVLRALPVLLLSLLAACADSGSTGDRGLGAIPPQEIEARFVPGGPQDVITLTVRDWRPLRSAMLVSPGGEHIPAYSLDVEPSPVTYGPFGAAASTLGLSSSRTVQVNTVVSVALIRPPDPIVYSKTWPDWHIEVAIGDGDERHEMTLPAPKSPPV